MICLNKLSIITGFFVINSEFFYKFPIFSLFSSLTQFRPEFSQLRCASLNYVAGCSKKYFSLGRENQRPSTAPFETSAHSSCLLFVEYARERRNERKNTQKSREKEEEKNAHSKQPVYHALESVQQQRTNQFGQPLATFLSRGNAEAQRGSLIPSTRHTHKPTLFSSFIYRLSILLTAASHSGL